MLTDIFPDGSLCRNAPRAGQKVRIYPYTVYYVSVFIRNRQDRVAVTDARDRMAGRENAIVSDGMEAAWGSCRSRR